MTTILASARNQMPVANLDGSATIEQISALASDMGRWSPYVVTRPDG